MQQVKQVLRKEAEDREIEILLNNLYEYFDEEDPAMLYKDHVVRISMWRNSLIYALHEEDKQQQDG